MTHHILVLQHHILVLQVTKNIQVKISREEASRIEVVLKLVANFGFGFMHSHATHSRASDSRQFLADKTVLEAKDYVVGWICALPSELPASVATLPERHPKLRQDPNDTNNYKFGRIGAHNVVTGCLPVKMPGLVSAASVAMQIERSFPSIRFGLMVGIGGGVPSPNSDIRLGDVVVSQPQGQLGGVVQYDMGKAVVSDDTGLEDSSSQRPGLIRTGALNSPLAVLLTALAAVQMAQLLEESKISEYLSATAQKYLKFAYPFNSADILYKAGNPSCCPR